MIRSVSLTNFRSFKQATVALSPLTLIYGTNGAGKSNFFDALRLLRYIGEGRSIRDAIEGHSTFSGGSLANVVAGVRGGGEDLTHLRVDDPVLKIVVDMTTRLGPVTYTVSLDASEYKVVQESLVASRHRGNYLYSTEPDGSPLKQAWDSPAVRALVHSGSPGRNPSRSFSAFEPILTQFTGRKADTAYNESFAQAVRDELSGITPLELRPEVLRQYSALGRFELGEHGESFAAAAWLLLRRAELEEQDPAAAQAHGMEAAQRRDAILGWLSKLTPRPITDLLVESAPTNEAIFAIREEGSDRPLSARSLSDGTLRFAAIALALLGDQQTRTFAIEEVENGLNPSRLHLLLQLMERAVVAEPNLQVLCTTHSPTLLEFANQTTVENAIALGWDAERDSSRVSRVSALRASLPVEDEATWSELLAEGWLQFAADR
jgi:predicted ATPase